MCRHEFTMPRGMDQNPVPGIIGSFTDPGHEEIGLPPGYIDLSTRSGQEQEVRVRRGVRVQVQIRLTYGEILIRNSPDSLQHDGADGRVSCRVLSALTGVVFQEGRSTADRAALLYCEVREGRWRAFPGGEIE